MIDINTLNETYERGRDVPLNDNGKIVNYKTYYIPIELLYYNNENGRIASYIEEYDDSHDENIDALYVKNKDEYNDLISDFVKDSSNDNQTSFKKTKADIRAKGQLEPGVILNDGRIVDGNRRFTALRELYDETHDPRFHCFICAVLETPETEEARRRIKSLELFLQFNEDKKRDYDIIDLLVSIYRDTIKPETKIMDDKDYIYSSGIKAAKYDYYKNVIDVMLDYLEWRGKPEAFYILKREKLDGPIEEIANKTKKMNRDEANNIKRTVYPYITLVNSGDRTRNVRELLTSAKKYGTLYNEFYKGINDPENAEFIEKAVEYKDIIPQTTEESETRSLTINRAANLLISTYSDAESKANLDKAENEPEKNLQNALDCLKKIDSYAIKKLPDSKKWKYKNLVNEIREAIDNIVIDIDKDE